MEGEAAAAQGAGEQGPGREAAAQAAEGAEALGANKAGGAGVRAVCMWGNRYMSEVCAWRGHVGQLLCLAQMRRLLLRQAYSSRQRRMRTAHSRCRWEPCTPYDSSQNWGCTIACRRNALVPAHCTCPDMS